MFGLIGISIVELAEDAWTFLPPVIAISLLAVLICRELLNGIEKPRLKRFSKALAVISLPLLIVFTSTALVRIIELATRYGR
jgi:hypothetical protein